MSIAMDHRAKVSPVVCLLGFATLALMVSAVAIYIKGHVAADIKLPWIEFHIIADPPPERPLTPNHDPA